MRSPFPGMDPYLESPALWPDFHNGLIASIRDSLVPLLAPRYFVALEERTYVLRSQELDIMIRPELAVIEGSRSKKVVPSKPRSPAELGVLEVQVPASEEVHETYIEVRETASRSLVTVVEVL